MPSPPVWLCPRVVPQTPCLGRRPGEDAATDDNGGTGGKATGGATGKGGTGGTPAGTGGTPAGTGGGPARAVAAQPGRAERPRRTRPPTRRSRRPLTPAPARRATVAGAPFAIPPGMTQIFDGKTLNGWTGSAAIWSVDPVEMAIHGKSETGGQLLKSAGDYDDFRLVVTEKAVATANHMGLCFWGTRPGNGYGGCLDVIPPSGHLWDYGGGGDVPNTGVGSANNPIKFMWHQVEILAMSTGEVLVAVNGKQTTTYKKAGRSKKGPIGLQSHAKPNDQMYKDIWVEPNPKERKLVTIKP